MSILVVDDNEMNLYQLQVLLGANGYPVATATNGAEALAQARQNPPDLVVSDILMPVMDGFSLCREWIQDERLRSIPFVFYTATYTDERDREFALSLGAVRFLIKPEEPEIILQTVQEVLRQVPESVSPVVEKTSSPPEEAFYLKQYNETLIRKLEQKMFELEETNRRLEQDIAERQRADAELQLIFKNMINAFVIWESVFDENEKYVSFRFGKFNDAYARITKLKYEEEVQGKDVFEVWPATEQSWVDVYGEVAVTGIPKTFDMYHEPTKGWYHCNAYRPTDSPMQICVIFQDITERKQAEEERARLQIQLNQAQKMESVGRLAGGVAHDFNNMLGVILGHTELAMGQVDPAQPLYADLEAIQKAADRSADLTRQLLAFARKQTATPEVLDLNATIEGMLKMLQRLIGEDMDLKWLSAANLWPTRVDPSQIDQILANLCLNARDAVADVGKITIETGNCTFDADYCAVHLGFKPGEYVRISVSDNGCGMDKETQEHVFEPFFTTKELGRGTGLGLATVYGIVRQNDGFINIYSEPGQGSTFSIYLPRYAGTVGQRPEAPPVKPISRGSETILLVEDELAILNMTKMMLEHLGYTVLTASSPGEAIRLAQEQADRIHLVMTDVVMPEMNGRDLAKRLLMHSPNLKRLFMSGYTADVIAHHGVLDDGVLFIQKPFTLKDLGAKIREALERN